MAKNYLSSTYADLVDPRRAVSDILRTVGYDMIAMENYVATNEPPSAKCLADVVSCDLYVGLIACRSRGAAGRVGPGSLHPSLDRGGLRGGQQDPSEVGPWALGPGIGRREDSDRRRVVTAFVKAPARLPPARYSLGVIS